MSCLPKRKALRLFGYDYSENGAYFITICTKGKKCILSRVIYDGFNEPYITLTGKGKIVKKYIENISDLDSYVIMPNHIHLIIIKDNFSKTDITKDIRSFKTLVSKEIKESIWQTGYYDHIIRDNSDFEIKAQYIIENPKRWADDVYYT